MSHPAERPTGPSDQPMPPQQPTGGAAGAVAYAVLWIPALSAAGDGLPEALAEMLFDRLLGAVEEDRGVSGADVSQSNAVEAK